MQATNPLSNGSLSAKAQISVIGLGYVGLTTAAALASRGYRVMGYDVDKQKVDRINRGEPTFYEPGLSSLLRKALRKGFRADTVLHESEVYFITVGTPSLKDGSVDLSYVKAAAESIAKALGGSFPYSLVVVKSTVPPGTTERVVKAIIERESGRSFGQGLGLVANPEFLREGSAVKDALFPDRLIVGELDKRSGDFLLELYRGLYGKRMPKVLRTTPVNAELIKYATNAFLAMKVSYINTIARLCERIEGADVSVVAEGLGMDARISRHFLRAGAGFGGSCLPKDLRGLIKIFDDHGLDAQLLKATLEVNEGQPMRLVEMAEEVLGDLNDKRIAVLGLSFKPNTDDMREAVSKRIILSLLEKGAYVAAYDPMALERAKEEFNPLGGRLSFASSPLEAIKGADCAMIVTEWEEFKGLKPRDFASLMRVPFVIDGRRIYDPKEFKGVKLLAVGLGKSG